MASLNFVNATGGFPKGNTSFLNRNIGNLTFDSIIVEDHNIEYELVQNPVESGANFSDHYFRKPYRLTVEGAVGSVSLSGSSSYSPDTGGTRAAKAWEALLALAASKSPFTVVTGLKKYNNMMITSIATTQDAQTATALFFTLELQEVQIAFAQIRKATPDEKKALDATDIENKGEGSKTALNGQEASADDALYEAGKGAGFTLATGQDPAVLKPGKVGPQ